MTIRNWNGVPVQGEAFDFDGNKHCFNDYVLPQEGPLIDPSNTDMRVGLTVMLWNDAIQDHTNVQLRVNLADMVDDFLELYANYDDPEDLKIVSKNVELLVNALETISNKVQKFKSNNYKSDIGKYN